VCFWFSNNKKIQVGRRKKNVSCILFILNLLNSLTHDSINSSIENFSMSFLSFGQDFLTRESTQFYGEAAASRRPELLYWNNIRNSQPYITFHYIIIYGLLQFSFLFFYKLTYFYFFKQSWFSRETIANLLLLCWLVPFSCDFSARFIFWDVCRCCLYFLFSTFPFLSLPKPFFLLFVLTYVSFYFPWETTQDAIHLLLFYKETKITLLLQLLNC